MVAHLDCSSSENPAQGIVALDEVTPQRRQRVQADHRIKDIAQRFVYFTVNESKPTKVTGRRPKLIIRIPSISWTMLKMCYSR